jgi:hypothetical protein
MFAAFGNLDEHINVNRIWCLVTDNTKTAHENKLLRYELKQTKS